MESGREVAAVKKKAGVAMGIDFVKILCCTTPNLVLRLNRCVHV